MNKVHTENSFFGRRKKLFLKIVAFISVVVIDDFVVVREKN